MTKSKARLAAEELILEAGENWPAPFVARRKINEFTGGIYANQTMANMDSAGTGPDGVFHIGRSAVYPIESLTEWLIDRIDPNL